MSTDNRKNLRLQPDVHELLKVEAAKSRISMQDLIVIGIKLHIKQRLIDDQKKGEFIKFSDSKNRKADG